MRRLMAFAWHAPRTLLVLGVRAYRLLLSPWLGQSCRFEPTCSRYAIGALERHGAVAGSLYAAWRILRCNPWCDGGCDPVPDNKPWERAKPSPSAAHAATGLFTGLLRDAHPDAAPASRPAAPAAGPTSCKTRP